MPPKHSFPKTPPKLIFRLTIHERLPSWNQILGMDHWQRAKLKDGIQVRFLCALKAAAAVCSMKTTSAKNTMSIAADTLESYRMIIREKRRLKSAKKRLAQKTLNAQRLKSLE